MNQDELVCVLKETEARSKSNTHRLDKMEERQESLDKLVNSVGILANRQTRIEDDVKEIKSDVKCLAEKPGKRWDSIVNSVIMLIIGAAVGYMMMKLGISS